MLVETSISSIVVVFGVVHCVTNVVSASVDDASVIVRSCVGVGVGDGVGVGVSDVR